ncbi:MAG TPA: hypothetical protein VGI64_02065 [Streptosporangiaceae bacterium]|jgi:hypothetical protein
MTLNSDEQAVRDLLDGLADGQPDPPASRLAGVRGRVTTRRRYRVLAAGVAAAVAVLAIIAGLTLPARQGGVAAGARRLPSWALRWPDRRDGSVPQRVLDGAVLAWRYAEAVREDEASFPLPRPAKIIWYAGQLVDGGQDVVTVFEVDTLAGPRLVFATAAAQDVVHGQAGWAHGGSPWQEYNVPAPDPATPGLEISTYLFSALDVHDNTLFALTAPDVTAIRYRTTGLELPASLTGQPAQSVTANDGLAVAALGRLTGRVQLTGLVTSGGNMLSRPVYVGVPGSFSSEVPALAPPVRLSLPRPFRQFTGATTAGGGAATFKIFPVLRPGEQAMILVRCYGPGSVSFRLSKDPVRGGTLGAFRCDNDQHQLPVPSGALGHGRPLQVSAGPLTEYTFAWGAERS